MRHWEFIGSATIGIAILSMSPPLAVAQGDPASGSPPSLNEKKDEITPEEKMRACFPQPIRTGDLVGLSVQDDQDRIFGYVDRVVRTPENRIELIVPYSGWFGWAPDYAFLEKRPVAVPIETVAILGRHLNALDFTRQDFEAAPVWTMADDTVVPADETIMIALGKR